MSSTKEKKSAFEELGIKQSIEIYKEHAKELPCPTCREVTEVKQGKASNLLKNFALLR